MRFDSLDELSTVPGSTFKVKYHPGHVWRILRQLNWSVQQPIGRALERNEGVIDQWKHRRWPEIKKKAQKEGRTIVFIDESGLSQRPHRRRTWAPRGQTPVLQFHFNSKTLSVIAGVTVWNFYFQIFEQAIRSEQIIEFLKHLLRYIEGEHSPDLGPASGPPQQNHAAVHT
jgi:DDE superfamily endonuclease/winged helix-turn-helix protein